MKNTPHKITGNTYPVKDKLKALGCRWDAAHKCWTASTDEMAGQARACVGEQPPLNSPAPQDLGPIDDAKNEAAKYNRISLNDASIPFRRPFAKNENPLGETFWGKHKGQRNRYLIVRAGRPYYMSRSTLEDFDLFHLDPGYYCDVQAIAVEPNADEIANDPAAAKAKAEAKSKRQWEIIRAIQNSPQNEDARCQSHPLDGMTKCWGKSRTAGHKALWSDGVSRLVYETSDYDMGPSSWETIDPLLAAEALTLKDL